MPAFTITQEIDAPVASVWEVLHDFGDIQAWNPGVKRSGLTSEGPVGEGSTRFCELAPFGGVDERIERHVPGQRLTVNIHQTRRLPISSAVADFNLTEKGTGTELVLHYSYVLSSLGKVLPGPVGAQLRKGIDGLVKSLERESKRLATP